MKIIVKIKRKIKRKIQRIIKKNISSHSIDYSYGLHAGKPRATKIIVSLTTFPQRFPTLHICLNSLIHQSYKPDKIIVWLDADVQDEQFTPEMIRMCSCGVEFRRVQGNLKPHNKYFWAMQKFRDSIIITLDDDIIYTRNMVASLMRSYRRFPQCVSARRVHKILWDDSGNIAPYNTWVMEYDKSTQPRYDLCATGVGGVLYPPHILPEEAFDIDAIRSLCLDADDIWLKFMEVKNSVPVVWARCFIILPPIIKGTQEIALMNTNVKKNRNDEMIRNMSSKYPDCVARMRKNN